jgi:AcrR family transcriptional regulator
MKASGDKGHRLEADEAKQRIVDAAERVFLRVDLAGATMSAIAVEAGVSRPTLYKYFSSIDELALAVQMRALEKIYATMERRAGEKGPAIERVETMLRDLAALCESDTAHLRFLGLFDHYYGSSYRDRGMAERYAAFLGRYDRIEGLIAEGKADGSLRPDLDAHNAAYMVGNVFLAMMQRLSARGDILKREQGVDTKGQFEELIEMVLRYARREKHGQGRAS